MDSHAVATRPVTVILGSLVPRVSALSGGRERCSSGRGSLVSGASQSLSQCCTDWCCCLVCCASLRSGSPPTQRLFSCFLVEGSRLSSPFTGRVEILNHSKETNWSQHSSGSAQPIQSVSHSTARSQSYQWLSANLIVRRQIAVLLQ